ENICTNFSGTLVNIAFRLHGYDLLLLETIRGCLKSLTWAIRNHIYTDKTCLRRFQILNFSLVHAGGLCLCSSEFIRRKLLRQPLRTLDALHLAVCSINNLSLVTADEKLAQSATILGIDILLLTSNMNFI
ncbi:MAG: PIN domain-containing protein, partial [Dolichospermum sp.]